MADAASLSAPRCFASSTNSPLTEIRDPDTFAALVHTPPRAADAEATATAAPLPLLLYLHGAGESGSQLWDIISEGATGTPPVELHFGRVPAWSMCSLGNAPARLLCLLGARLAALGSSVLPKKKYRARPGRCSATGHPPLPRLIELVASKVADFTAFDHSGALPALAQQFCVVAPQTASGWPAARVHAFMRFLLAAESPLPCRIDPSRCYATGHSMGGSGALVS